MVHWFLRFLSFQLIFGLSLVSFASPEGNGLIKERLKLLLGFDSKLSLAKAKKQDEAVENLLLEWTQAFRTQGQRVICRRPGLYELLRQSGEIFGDPVDSICPSLLFVTSEGEQQSFRFKDLTRLNYILAGKGDEMGSRFGHAMIGILTCPSSNPNCSNSQLKPSSADYTEYIAGFVAKAVGSYSLLGGLKGTYPTQLTFNYAANVRKKYLYDDFRSMISVPLNFNADQKRLFVYLLEERFWFYHNHYKFINNNCASEVLKLMKLVLPVGNSIDRLGSSFLTPMRLLKQLVTIGIGDSSTIEDLKNKVPPVESYILNTMGKRMTLENYLELDPTKRRQLFLSKISEFPNAQERKQDSKFKALLAQWKILEKASLRESSSARDKFLWDWMNDERRGSKQKAQLSCFQDVSARKDKLLNDPIYYSSRLLAGDFVPGQLELVPLDLKQSATERGSKLFQDIASCAGFENEMQKNLYLQQATQANLKIVERLAQ